MKKTIVAAVLALSSMTVLAADYYIVLPVKGRTGESPAIQVALAAGSPPAGIAGQPYAGFDFRPLLMVTGDPNFAPANVRWAVVRGALPAGLTLGADGLLQGTPTAASTATFEVRATYKTRNGAQSYQVLVAALTVSLDPSVLPPAMVGAPYSFSLRDKLQVSGDASYSADGVAWSILSGALPPGLVLQADGVVAGTPTAVTSAVFRAQALYKGQPATQSYAIQATSRPARFDASRLVGWTAPITLAQANTALDAAGLVWTVNARPAGYTGQTLRLNTSVASLPTDAYVEIVSTTNSAWVMLESEDGTTNGVALDGPGCTRNSTFVATCTSNSAGNWANSRFGLRYEKSSAKVTIYRNGAQVYQQTGVPGQLVRLRVQDRDAPVNASSRTYTLFNSPASWAYAPAGVQPFGMD